MTHDDTALAIQNADGFTPQQIDLIRSQIAPDATRDQLALFLEVCRGTGLNPFMRQIHAVFRNAKDRDGKWTKRMTIQTGIDGYRVLAARTGQLAGIDDAIYDDESGKHPGKATVTVYRLVGGQRVAFTATARWSEYVQTDKDGNPTSMWVKMPYLMLGKCAEALALRKAFPAELSGVYTAEEMMQADNTLPEPPRATIHRATPPESPHTTTEPSDIVDATPAPPERESTQAPDPMDTTIASPKEQTDLAEKMRKAGYDTLPTAQGFLNDIARHVDALALKQGTSDVTLRELAAITQRLTRLTAQANGKAVAK